MESTMQRRDILGMKMHFIVTKNMIVSNVSKVYDYCDKATTKNYTMLRTTLN